MNFLSTQNVKVARFARNVEWDFFCDFQTMWIGNGKFVLLFLVMPWPRFQYLCQTSSKFILNLNNKLFCRLLVGQYVTVHGEVVSHVNISQVSVQDGGLYQCQASNRAGSAGHSARLNIYGKCIFSLIWSNRIREKKMILFFSRPTPCPPTWRTSSCCWQRVFGRLSSQWISHWQDHLD